MEVEESIQTEIGHRSAKGALGRQCRDWASWPERGHLCSSIRSNSVAATEKFAAQAIRKAYDIGWTPARYLAYPSRSIVAVMKPVGLEKSKGVISANFAKDPTDARWKDDFGMKEWQAFCAKYHMLQRWSRCSRSAAPISPAKTS